ncbi:MAG: glycolate oxidase FAD binding subunit [Halieaceae bacterium]|jgi:glycolate oxidase FAD binding subunit
MTDISAQLVEQVNAALGSGTLLRIEGNNTKSQLGREQIEEGETISLSSHTGVVQYEPVELIVTARAGTTLAEIDEVLGEHNQILACDPRRYNGAATIGGSLASNQSGNARPWSGSLRDHVLGIKLINGKGEHLQFGGQVLKNVAGYDVSRLQAGAMGTLGVITEVSFKVLPAPAASTTLTKELPAEQALREMNRLGRSVKPLSGAGWVDGKLYLRLQGAHSAVRATIQQWQKEIQMQRLEPKLADTFWHDLREHQLDFYQQRSSDEPLWRFSVKSNAAHFLGGEPWAFNWSGAQRWLKGRFDSQQMRELARSAGGEVQLYAGGDRDGELCFVSNDALKRIHQNVKNAFDPQGIFNPGRLYGWL